MTGGGRSKINKQKKKQPYVGPTLQISAGMRDGNLEGFVGKTEREFDLEVHSRLKKRRE